MDDDQTRTDEVLSWLLESANDAVENLRQASNLARNPDLRGFFAERAEEGEKLASELRSGLEARRVQPSKTGTLVGELQRAFAQGRNMISGDSDKGLVEEAARGAGMAEDRFNAVAGDERMPQAAREAAAVALGPLKAQHEALDQLRDQYA